MDTFFVSLVALIIAAGSLAYALNTGKRIRRLERDQQRTRLLNRMTECTVVINRIMEDMSRYDEYSRTAFGDNPNDAPNLTETLLKVENLHSSFSDYSHDTPLDKLEQATTNIEKVLDLMRSIAAKSPRLQSGTT